MPKLWQKENEAKTKAPKTKAAKMWWGVFFQGADHFARRPEKAKVRLENFRVNNIFQILCKSFAILIEMVNYRFLNNSFL